MVMRNNTSLVKLSEIEKENRQFIFSSQMSVSDFKKVGNHQKGMSNFVVFCSILRKHDVRTCAKMLKNPEEINDNEAKLTSLKIS